VKALVRLHRWHQTSAGLVIFGLAELAVSAGLTSRAFETGSIIEYFLALVFLVGALQNLVKLARKFIGGPRQATKA
jgi:hypothetical protein